MKQFCPFFLDIHPSNKKLIDIQVWFLPYKTSQFNLFASGFLSSLPPNFQMNGYFPPFHTCDRGELDFFTIEAFGSRAIIAFVLNKMMERCRLEVLNLPDLILCRIPMTQSVAFCEGITWLMCDHFLTRLFYLWLERFFCRAWTTFLLPFKTWPCHFNI